MLKASKSLKRCHMSKNDISNAAIDSGSDPQYAIKLYLKKSLVSFVFWHSFCLDLITFDCIFVCSYGGKEWSVFSHTLKLIIFARTVSNLIFPCCKIAL